MDESRLGALGEGAAEGAPTAPHATPRVRSRATRTTGPERFWGHRRVRIALAFGFVGSVLFHAPLLPLSAPAPFDLRDVEGEAAIPVDLLAPDLPPPAAPLVEAPQADAPPEPSAPTSLARKGRTDAGLAGHDGGALDAGGGKDAHDVAFDASEAGPDAGGRGPMGGSAIDAAAVFGDGGGEPDPHAIVGAAAAVQPKVINVVLVISAEVIRKHPVGATMGFLLRGIPQWDDFMAGTTIDPVRDIDWFMVSGASLVNTERDVVLIHYSASDAVIDRAVSVLSRKTAKGGPFDVGVPGVKAVLAHADRADRVIMRPAAHLLAIVPPGDAQKTARQLVSARVTPPLLSGEAVFLRLVKPQRPLPELPESITELRLRVVPRADGGADVFAEGDTPDDRAAVGAAEAVARIVRRHNDTLTSLFTHGLFDHVEVISDGPRVKAHLSASRDQVETVVALAGTLLGIAAPGPPAPPSTVSPQPVGTPRPLR